MLVRLLQWNVWYLEELDRIARQVEELSPDILCLQELCTNSSVNPGVSTGHELAARLGLRSFIQTAQTWTGWNKDSQENGILSRFPLERTASVFIREPGARESRDFSQEGRVYLEADLNIDGHKLTVGTTHLSYSHGFKRTEARSAEYARLLSLLKARKGFVFTGDLNSPPDSEIVQELSTRYVNCGPSFSACTWTTKPFECSGFVETGLNWRLDYVFASSDIKVVSSRIVETQVSDHLPILTELEL